MVPRAIPTPTDTAVAQKCTIILGMCFVSDKKPLPTQRHSDVTNYVYEPDIYNNLPFEPVLVIT